MDKRYKALSVPEQLALRLQAIEEVLAHPEWTLQHSVRHLKRTLRLTSAELARLAGVSTKTVQDIEQGAQRRHGPDAEPHPGRAGAQAGGGQGPSR